jgi:hypothetical protein
VGVRDYSVPEGGAQTILAIDHDCW